MLGDAVVETSIAALKEKLAKIEGQESQQQRKLATILFMDMVAHTAMIRNLDLEDQLEVVDQALTRLSQPIYDFGGQISRYQGDGYKAIFGLSGDEHNPDHAIQAGLAIHKKAEELATRLEQEWGLPDFRVRVGIDTGMVIVGGQVEGEDSISGPPVNLAARLEKSAAPGTILISQHTYGHVRGVFDLQPLDPIRTKGFNEPIAVYRVLRSKPRAFRTRRRGVQGVDTRMIGRSAELSQLQDTFHHMMSEEKQQWITIIGQAGLGKSRLLYEFEQWIDLHPRFITLYRGRARQEMQHASYGLLRTLFAFRFNILDDDPPHETRQKFVAGFEEWLGPEPETAIKAQIVGQLIGFDFKHEDAIRALSGDPQQLRSRALSAMITYFRAASSSPIVAFLEDIHWADESSLDILTRLSITQTERPVLIIATARPQLLERRPDFMHDQPHHQFLKLSPLSLPDSRRLVSEVLKRVEELPTALQELVVTNAGGNPYFVEELVKMLIADGLIVKHETYWQVSAKDISKIQVPATVTGVLQARLEGLPQAERQIIEQASIAGMLFWDQLIHHMNIYGKTHLTLQETEDGLDGLCAKEMIYKMDASQFSGTAEYAFRHAILRQVTYDSILKRPRQTYHLQAAGWLINQNEKSSWQHTAAIAEQFQLGADKNKAIRYLSQAGDEAVERFANKEAQEFLSRALSICHENDYRARFNLHTARLSVYHRLGDRDREEKDLQAAEAIAKNLEDDQRLASTKWHWAIFYENVGSHDDAIREARECARLAQKIGNLELEAKGYIALGRVLWRKGALHIAQEELQKALKLTQKTGERQLEGNANLNLGNIAGDLGDLDAARHYYEQALIIDREIQNLPGEGIDLNNLGILSAMAGNLAKAQEYFEQSLQIARHTGNSSGEGLALGNLGNVTADRKDFVASKKYFEEYLTIALNIRNRSGEGHALHGIAYALLGSGRYSEAESYFKQAVNLREEMGLSHLAIESRAGWAKSVLSQNNAAHALNLLEPVLHLLQSQPGKDRYGSIETHLFCIQILQANEDQRASDFLTAAYQLVQERAAKIDNLEERLSFLENVETNREIIHLWKKNG